MASRFRDITEVHINSLLKVTFDGEEFDMAMDKESRIRVIPFLSKFDSLERVVFGAKDENNGKDMAHFALANAYFFEGDGGYPNEGPRDSLKAFLDNISGALSCGALPQHMKFSGLCCPDASNSHSYRGDRCETCIRACKQFPLESVVEFECRGSSCSNAWSGRMYGLDVCV